MGLEIRLFWEQTWLTWTGGEPGSSASLYRAPFGTYPEYDDLGSPSVPNPAAAPGAPWALVTSGAAPGYVDHPPARGACGRLRSAHVQAGMAGASRAWLARRRP